MPKVIDLFCGCGGVSLGFAREGFEIVAGIDNDQEALNTFSKNFPHSKALNVDLSNTEAIDYEEFSNVDIILGGPPCQGFSIAGKRDSNDPRNKLSETYIELVKTLNPKVVVIENVPNILKMANGIFTKYITESLESLGYSVIIEKINAADYGVPQKRKRVFFIGFKNKNYIWPFELKNIQSKKVFTCFDALNDLPSLEKEIGDEEQNYVSAPQNEFQEEMRKNSKKVFNHIAVDHKDRTKKIISLVPDGGNYKDLPKEYQKTRKVNIAWTRMKSTEPCFTIDAGHNHHFHYKFNRVPTVRECARIQSFPDNFTFTGTRTNQYRQVGNAVPPLLAQKIANLIKNKI